MKLALRALEGARHNDWLVVLCGDCIIVTQTLPRDSMSNSMDYNVMKMKSVVNAQTISEESITCIAVKEDRHLNIMSSVALKKGLEEPWTVEGAKFIDLLGYREITR